MTLRTITFDDEQWQLVPREPTEDMLLRGYSALMAWDARTGDDNGIREVFRAMLANAPEPPAQQRAMIPPGMREFDALIDFIHEHGADSEGVKGMAERLVSAFMPPAQQPPEPAAYMYQHDETGRTTFRESDDRMNERRWWEFPLYRHPAPAQQPMTRCATSPAVQGGEG